MGRSTTRKRRVRSPWSRRFKIVFFTTFILVQVVFLFASLEAAKRLQQAAELVPKLPDIMLEINSQPSEVIASDGTVLFQTQLEYREPVKRIDIPRVVVDAILAGEDKRFYKHSGVDLRAMGRIAREALRERKATQGGSTLTMQIAKRVFTSNQKSLDRKLNDMALAIMIERMLTKDQILELYLNQVFFGEGAYGIAAAAEVYFDKELDELTISEAATLARVVRLPSSENPIKSPEKAKENRDKVLRTMREEDWITEQEFQDALAEEIVVSEKDPMPLSGQKKHPYFVDYVLAQLKAKDIDITAGGHRVYTTIDPRAQKIAEDGVKWGLSRFGRRAVNQMSFLCVDNRGRIIAMVGGPDYQKSNYNMLWMGQGRQPGSTFKPFVYAAGLELGAFDSRSRISTSPFYIQDGGRRRAIEGGANRGSISLASALASSNNTAAVRAQEMVGTKNVVRMANNAFGFHSSRIPEVTTLALGVGEVHALELAAAYGVFQSHGDRYESYGIERVVFPDGSEETFIPKVATNVISEGTAEAVDVFLRGTVTSGTGRTARPVTNARGKTGTTSDHKDAWFVGYTDRLIGIVWMGREVVENGRVVAAKMSGVYGGEAAAPTWTRIMQGIQKLYPEEERRFGRAPVVQNDPEPEDDEPVEEITVPVVPDDPVDPQVDLVDPGADPPADPPVRNTTGTTGTGGGREDVVYVTVCADTGQRASIYCPEASQRPYVKGTEPRGSCTVHGP